MSRVLAQMFIELVCVTVRYYKQVFAYLYADDRVAYLKSGLSESKGHIGCLSAHQVL